MKILKNNPLPVIALFFFFASFPITAIGQIRGFNPEDTSERTHSDNAVIKAPVRSKNASSNTVGNVYINNNWKTADIILNGSNELITGIPVRMNAHKNQLEIQHDGKVKTLESDNIKSILIENEKTTYITNSLLVKNSPEGFYRLIYNQHSSLLCYYYSEIRQSNYNRAMDIGERKDAVVIMNDYYLLFHGKLIKLESNRRKMARQFGYNDKIYNYILSEKIHPKNEFDLVKFATFCDSLNNNT